MSSPQVLINFAVPVGLCGGFQWVKDLLPACVRYVVSGCATISSNVPVPREENVQVSVNRGLKPKLALPSNDTSVKETA